jgi:CheY-like chemotaxis protein
LQAGGQVDSHTTQPESFAEVNAMSENPKILIVDDNELNIKLCSAILKNTYQVFAASSAEEGLESAIRIHPDLILMDIQLPGMDGLAATAVIKSNEDLKAIPVIALTSFAMVGDREKAISAGCDEYLSKPIDIRNLKAMIARFLECPRATRRGTKIGSSHETEKADLAVS